MATAVFCDRTCSEQYAIKAELAGGETREKGLTEKRGAVTDAREELEHRIEQKTHSHMTVFEDIARRVDVGFSGPEAIQWSRLVYLPFPKMLDKRCKQQGENVGTA